MSTLNQCTYAITSNTPLLQYYRICLTCSKDHQIVRACLNCISICHENHKIGPVLREKFYCQCHLYAHCCRALSNFEAHDESSSSTKKRKRNNAATGPTEDAAEKGFVVWSRHNQESKKLICSYPTLEEANDQAKHIFFQDNPWGWIEREIVQNEEYNIATNRSGNVVHQVQDPTDREAWHVGTSSVDSFLEEVNRNFKPQFQRLSDLKQYAVASSSSAVKTPKSGLKSGGHQNMSSLPFNDHDDDEMVIFTTNRPLYDDATVTKEEKKVKKRRKEVGAPKGPVHSFMIFSNMNRDRIQSENPGISMVELSKVIGARWKEIDAEARQPYEELAIADRMRYAKEMEEYRRKKADGTLELPPVKTQVKRGPRKKKSDVESEAFAEASVSSGKPVTKGFHGEDDGDESISDASSGDDVKDDGSLLEKEEEEDLMDEEEDGSEAEVKREADVSREEDDDENSETIMFTK